MQNFLRNYLPQGVQAVVTATPGSSDWGFYKWTGDEIEASNERDNPLDSPLTEDITLSARFMPVFHSADYDHTNPDMSSHKIISLTELIRFIQLYNSDGYHCADPPSSTDDGFKVGIDSSQQNCNPHSADYWGGAADWKISLNELLRVVQFYNMVNLSVSSESYHLCVDGNTEDDYCPGAE